MLAFRSNPCYYFDIKAMGTRYQGSQEEVRALNAFITLMRSADAISAFTHAHLKEADLTVSQFGALEALYHCGDLCQGELAGKLLRTMGSVTSLIAGLERRGLVERARRSEDKRFVRVKLTDQGRGLVRKLLPRHVKLIATRFRAISAADQERLRDICRRLGRGRS